MDTKINTANQKRLVTILSRAHQLEELLADLPPEQATQVFALVLAVRGNEQCEAIMRAARGAYQRKTLAEVVAPYKPTITFPERK